MGQLPGVVLAAEEHIIFRNLGVSVCDSALVSPVGHSVGYGLQREGVGTGQA